MENNKKNLAINAVWTAMIYDAKDHDLMEKIVSNIPSDHSSVIMDNINMVVRYYPEVVRSYDIDIATYADLLRRHNPQVLKFMSESKIEEYVKGCACQLGDVIKGHPELVTCIPNAVFDKLESYRIEAIISAEPNVIKYIDPKYLSELTVRVETLEYISKNRPELLFILADHMTVDSKYFYTALEYNNDAFNGIISKEDFPEEVQDLLDGILN